MYKRQLELTPTGELVNLHTPNGYAGPLHYTHGKDDPVGACLLYTSDAADERSSVDLGGRRIIKKKIRYTRTRRKRESHKRDNQSIVL